MAFVNWIYKRYRVYRFLNGTLSGTLNRGDIILKDFKHFVAIISLLFFSSCGGQKIFPSIEFDSCFMNYKNRSLLQNQLKELTSSITLDVPNPPMMAVIGCINYQLNNLPKAEHWLKRAYNISKTDDQTRSISAGALGLIYLKQQTHQHITPYLVAARGHHLGRWMLILYYIDYYRKYNNAEYLLSAIKYIEEKHKEEGDTSATRRLLGQMQLIYSMDQICKTEPNSPQCLTQDLVEEQRYLFSTAWGFLSMLLKRPPFNHFTRHKI